MVATIARVTVAEIRAYLGKRDGERKTWWGRWAWAAGAGTLALSVACGIAIQRDLSAIPAGQVSYDDACGLQQYFDTLDAKRVSPPRVVSGNELQGEREGKNVHGGHSRFAFETAFEVREVKRLLKENWKNLPEGLDKASRLDIDVYWSEVAGIRRVVTERDAALYVAPSDEPQTLPYHVCLSELLFGEPLYKERRNMLGLTPLPSILSSLDGGTAPAAGDAGASVGAGGAGGSSSP